MHGVNLWWFVSLPDMKFEYRRSTQEKMEQSLKNKEIKSYTIVHPENPMYSKKLRQFNKRYLHLINSGYTETLRMFLNLKNKPNKETKGVFNADETEFRKHTYKNKGYSVFPYKKRR